MSCYRAIKHCIDYNLQLMKNIRKTPRNPRACECVMVLLVPPVGPIECERVLTCSIIVIGACNKLFTFKLICLLGFGYSCKNEGEGRRGQGKGRQKRLSLGSKYPQKLLYYIIRSKPRCRCLVSIRQTRCMVIMSVVVKRLPAYKSFLLLPIVIKRFGVYVLLKILILWGHFRHIKV